MQEKINENNEIYTKNMVVIQEVHPELGEWIKGQPDQDWIKQEGDQLYIIENGRSIPMYNRENPHADAAEVKKTVKANKENVTVLIGAGLGHTLNALLKITEKGHHIVIVEPVGHMLRLLLGKYDLTKQIKDHSILFAPGKAEVDAIFGVFESLKVVEDWNVLAERVCQNRAEYWKIIAYVTDALNAIQCNTGTVVSAGGKIADNDIATLPYVIRHRGVAELVGLYKGKPAVMVGTGPSLARNIHLLKEAQGRVVIVAVAQALRPLLAYDIRPDFICTVDFGEVNMTHLAGLMDETVPLVTINKAYAPMLRAYKGPKFICASVNQGFEETSHGILKDKGQLEQGGSVAHMAYSLTSVLGCEPIMFVGMNLALGSTSHFMQADSAGHVTVENGAIKWVVDDPRSKTLHARQDISMGPETYVKGWWGDHVLTNSGLVTFITAFERMIAWTKAKTIDCTEGGAYKKGTTRMFLANAFTEYAKEPIDKSVINPLLSLAPDADALISKLIPLLETDLKLLKILIEQSELGLKTVLKLRNTSSPRKLKLLFLDNAKHSQAAFEAARRMPTVSTSIYGASRAIQSRALNVEADAAKLCTAAYKKDRFIRLDRNELILKAAKTAGESLKMTYEETHAIFLDYMQGKAGVLDPIGDPDTPRLDDADHYLSTGAFAKPLLEARRMLRRSDTGAEDFIHAQQVEQRAEELREGEIMKAQQRLMDDRALGQDKLPKYLDLIDKALELGRDEKKFEEAMVLLKEAKELQPEREEARWGLGSAYNTLGRMEEARSEYAELVEKFPTISRYKFEYGQVLVKLWADDAPIVELQDGIKWIREAMSTSDEFDHFLLTYAAILKRAGLNDRAEEALNQYKTKFPNDVEATWEAL